MESSATHARERPFAPSGGDHRSEALFPNGELSEDRDFMIASALHELGRIDEQATHGAERDAHAPTFRINETERQDS